MSYKCLRDSENNTYLFLSLPICHLKLATLWTEIHLFIKLLGCLPGRPLAGNSLTSARSHTRTCGAMPDPVNCPRIWKNSIPLSALFLRQTWWRIDCLPLSLFLSSAVIVLINCKRNHSRYQSYSGATSIWWEWGRGHPLCLVQSYGKHS